MAGPDEELERRKLLTFAQSEGVEPIPQQLRLGEISKQLRALVWRVLHGFIESSVTGGGLYGVSPHLNSDCRSMLFDWFTLHEHGLADEFNDDPDYQLAYVKQIIVSQNYVGFFEFLQFVVRHRGSPPQLGRSLNQVLQHSQSAYRIIENTVMPVPSAAEAATVERTFADLAGGTFPGARRHLRRAGELLTRGNWADSIRESVHAVEAAAKQLEPQANTLGPALVRLEKAGTLNPNLKRGFNALYDYTSDEQGVRHALVEQEQPNVGEAEAVYMFGACAAFVGYLIRSSPL